MFSQAQLCWELDSLKVVHAHAHAGCSRLLGAKSIPKAVFQGGGNGRSKSSIFSWCFSPRELKPSPSLPGAPILHLVWPSPATTSSQGPRGHRLRGFWPLCHVHDPARNASPLHLPGPCVSALCLLMGGLCEAPLSLPINQKIGILGATNCLFSC